jgi:hypothetical protein
MATSASKKRKAPGEEPEAAAPGMILLRWLLCTCVSRRAGVTVPRACPALLAMLWLRVAVTSPKSISEAPRRMERKEHKYMSLTTHAGIHGQSPAYLKVRRWCFVLPEKPAV